MYQWLVALHLIGLAAFLIAHGVSMWVSFRVRGEPNREVIVALLGLSAQGNRLLYVGLLLLGIGGLGAAWNVGWLLAPWVIASYVVLVVVLLLMWIVGAGYYYTLRDAVVGTEKTPRLDDEALALRLRSGRPEALALIGGIGLVVLILLMTLKPGV